MSHTRIVLYITGRTARSTRATHNLQALCSAAGIDAHSLEIVDVVESPDIADAEGILATPTVVFHRGGSTRRVIGDLSDLHRLASALDIDIDLPASRMRR